MKAPADFADLYRSNALAALRRAAATEDSKTRSEFVEIAISYVILADAEPPEDGRNQARPVVERAERSDARE